MTNDELDMVETEDLLAVLARRFDSYLFVLIQNRSEDAEERGLYYAGGLVTAIGMAEWAKNCLLNDKASNTPRDDDDE